MLYLHSLLSNRQKEREKVCERERERERRDRKKERKKERERGERERKSERECKSAVQKGVTHHSSPYNLPGLYLVHSRIQTIKSEYQTFIYRPTISCLHVRAICMI